MVVSRLRRVLKFFPLVFLQCFLQSSVFLKSCHTQFFFRKNRCINFRFSTFSLPFRLGTALRYCLLLFRSCCCVLLYFLLFNYLFIVNCCCCCCCLPVTITVIAVIAAFETACCWFLLLIGCYIGWLVLLQWLVATSLLHSLLIAVAWYYCLLLLLHIWFFDRISLVVQVKLSCCLLYLHFVYFMLCFFFVFFGILVFVLMEIKMSLTKLRN